MPFKTNDDLPDNVLHSLTDEHARNMFRKVFNSAYEEYENEEQAFKVAWAAVKKEYEKNEEGRWVKK
jgi:cation transport regulator